MFKHTAKVLMRANPKLYWVVLAISLISFACQAPPISVTVAVTPSANPATITPAPPVVSSTPSPRLIPKHNDLMFVEFFAIT